MSPKKEKLKILTSKKILNVLRSSLETVRHISLRDTGKEDENQNFVSLRLSQNNYGLLVNSHKIFKCVSKNSPFFERALIFSFRWTLNQSIWYQNVSTRSSPKLKSRSHFYSNCLSHSTLHLLPHSGNSFYQLPIFLLLLVTCPLPSTLSVFLSPFLIYLSLQDDLSQALISLYWPKYFSFCFF